MKKFALLMQSWGPGGAFLLAVMDSAGVPLPGGVVALIVAIAATNPAEGWLTAAVAVVGSAIGSMVLFEIARKGGQLYLDRHTASPRTRKLREWFQHYGLVTVFVPALIPFPMPLKVFVLSAGATGVPPLRFLAVVVAARIPCYFAMAWLGMHLGDEALPWLKAHTLLFSVVGLTLIAALLLLLGRMNRSSTMSA
ncbi:MAG: VTT domain-containing protein [Acidobacteriota bacterium]